MMQYCRAIFADSVIFKVKRAYKNRDGKNMHFDGKTFLIIRSASSACTAANRFSRWEGYEPSGWASLR